MDKINAFPLQWPVGWKRTAHHARAFGQFGSSKSNGNYRSKEKITVYEAVNRLHAELVRFGVPANDIVVSTNLPLRLDGRPRSDTKAPDDPGAAVYWRDGGHTRCMAIDRYTKVEQNIAALAATIEAMRAIERHGGAAILDRAFTGFAALPAPIAASMKRPWNVVLGIPDGPVSRDLIRQRYRELASQLHPDLGGSHDRMTELNAARDEAMGTLP